MGEGSGLGGGPLRGALRRAALLALLLGLAAPASAAARPSHARARPALSAQGTIEGTVTDSSSHLAIAGIEVCAYLLEREAPEPACAVTNAAGTYALNIAAGTYIVEFSSPFGSGLDYVTTYQGGAASFEAAEAHPLSVLAGQTAKGIDAAMHLGGRIEGHVAAAEDPGLGIAGIAVCAGGIKTEGFGCALTGPGGGYLISALPEGQYLVFFQSPPEGNLDYLPQFYNGSATEAGATPVAVTLGATTTGIGALLARGGEITGQLTSALGGVPLAGARACALTSETKAAKCAFTGPEGTFRLLLAPGSYALGFSDPGYQWQYYPHGQSFSLAQRIAVAAGTGVGLQPTELLPIGYVPPPPVQPAPPPPPPGGGQAAAATTQAPGSSVGVAGSIARSPAITVSSAHLHASHGRVSLSVGCAGAACQGTFALTMRVAYRGRRHGRAVTLHRIVEIAQGAFSLAPGAEAQVSLRETAAGRVRLAHAARAAVQAQLLGSVSGGAVLTVPVRVS